MHEVFKERRGKMRVNCATFCVITALVEFRNNRLMFRKIKERIKRIPEGVCVCRKLTIVFRKVWVFASPNVFWSSKTGGGIVVPPLPW